jgi:hypothetical protein
MFFELTTFASRWRLWRLARTDAIAQWRQVQERIPLLEIRGKVAYACWLGRILEGGAKNSIINSLRPMGAYLLTGLWTRSWSLIILRTRMYFSLCRPVRYPRPTYRWKAEVVAVTAVVLVYYEFH